MLHQEISLNELSPEWDGSLPQSHITLYLHTPSVEIEENRRYPCVVVCPGGAYAATSDREAEPVALRLAAHGYSVAVVRYSTGKAKFPVQLCELSLAVAWLRRNAQRLHIAPERIAVCGFSAGGHLAASLCNLWQLPEMRAMCGIEKEENRPNAAILCYPVITAGEFAHTDSFDNLLGEELNPDVKAALSLETSVNKSCPPTFLWHTAKDELVPVENSILYAAALSRCQVPFEMHIYPEGVHGLSLCDETTAPAAEYVSPTAAHWFENAIRFLDHYLR